MFFEVPGPLKSDFLNTFFEAFFQEGPEPQFSSIFHDFGIPLGIILGSFSMIFRIDFFIDFLMDFGVPLGIPWV